MSEVETNNTNTNYFGKKGYTIQKCKLTQTQLYELRKELTVKPNSGMPGYSSAISYPIYRESTSKIYIPRYYGIEKFGEVSRNVVSKGEDISLQFARTLYDYQDVIVNKFIQHVGESGGGLLDVEPGKGKTVMGLNIISRLGKKTLVVVHKEFLLRQWEERISECLPGSRVGIIQGKTIDTEDKDIVIGMLQTLSTKQLPEEIVKEFGLAIYDECHHLSAEVFSRVMININLNYTIGLSGTMTRKDGLTKVFKWFVGPIVHKEKSDTTQDVLVKAVSFDDPGNDEYNEVETDFKGNPQYSRMITKICSNNSRTDMIVNIVNYEINQPEKQQIMILAHNKALINELYNKISSFESSLGLYIGGMKENDLKESESKRVIIATYAMASEGLDIKTLTTLLMATPKTDVCQSVGRILRSKHSRPLVIDVVDSHDVFKRQYGKRRTYYNKKNYKIQKYEHLNDYLNNKFTNITKVTNKKSTPKCYINLPESAF